MVWDMRKGRFPTEEDEAVSEQPPPLRLEHLEYFIELSHLTDQYKNNNESTLVFHSTEKNRVRSQVSNIRCYIKDFSSLNARTDSFARSINLQLAPS
ncbi:Protein of unknown function [Gryllus bimaculatus]|nr:Protein of unknown function [Gryllus bimaculatus]